jgi:hypothetical protein
VCFEEGGAYRRRRRSRDDLHLRRRGRQKLRWRCKARLWHHKLWRLRRKATGAQLFRSQMNIISRESVQSTTVLSDQWKVFDLLCFNSKPFRSASRCAAKALPEPAPAGCKKWVAEKLMILTLRSYRFRSNRIQNEDS